MMKQTRETEKVRRAQYEKLLQESPLLYRAAQQLPLPGGDAAALAGSRVLAPALAGFTGWLVKQAAGSGKKRLYFLARDGYLMYRAARILCERLSLPIDCRYLSCSRYSLRLPFFHRDREAALDYICRGGMEVTLPKILGRAGLTPQEARQAAAALSLPFSAKEKIPRRQLPEVRRQLAGCPWFLERMDEHSRRAMPGLTGYLKQEGLLEELPYAIVDSGWVGSMQKALGDILRSLGREQRLEGYYWGLYDLPAGARREDYHVYFFGPEGAIREKVYFNNCLFEAVYSAPHGMTLGYREQEGRYFPLYGKTAPENAGWSQKLEAWLSRYMTLLSEEIARSPSVFAPSAGVVLPDVRRTTRRLLRLFMAAPSRAEAEVFGGLPFSDDVLDGQEKPLAERLSGKELAESHFLQKLLAAAGLRNPPARESAWYEGSAALYGRHVRYHLFQYRLYQCLRYLQKSARFRAERREKTHE